MSIRAKAPPKNLTELTRQAMADLVAELGEPRYRADQLYEWVFRHGARDLESMTNLPKALRRDLDAQGWTIGRLTVDTVETANDGTRKAALRLADGGLVESVLIPMAPGRFTQCLSSQVGCAMGCRFCHTATLGLARHLTPGEIIDQVLLGRELMRGIDSGDARVSNLVFMGMGEPLHNFEGVTRSIEVICDPRALDYSHGRVTVSTSGLVPEIERLARTVPVDLAVSLNATTDEVRDALMPINARYPIARLMEALRRYPRTRRHGLTIEYVLLSAVNDSDADALRLSRLIRGLAARVNLLAWNPIDNSSYERPSEDRVRSFQAILQAKGVTVTVRSSRGGEIHAACGQLGLASSAA